MDIVHAFRDAILERARHVDLANRYAEVITWTEEMDQIVKHAWKKISAGHPDVGTPLCKEMYTVDWAFRLDENSCFPQTRWWFPANPYLLVESENGDHPEEEMWKLVHWRAPHKVLFIRDWSEEQKAKTARRRKWVGDKLQLFGSILREAHKSFSENLGTRYYVFSANKPLGSAPDVQWHVFAFGTRGVCSPCEHFSVHGKATPNWPG